jgi:putative spermidine/putrescine transport system permease protein
MPETGGRRGRVALLAVALVAGVLPLATLVVRAAADEWRAPGLLPQRWGTRGVEVVLADGAVARAGVVNSLLVALVTTALALVIAWPAARVVGAHTRGRGRLVWVVLGLPLLVPPYATGSGLAEWAIRLGVADTRAGLVVAHLVMVVPYVLLVLAAGFGPDVRAREEAAAVHGAGSSRARCGDSRG